MKKAVILLFVLFAATQTYAQVEKFKALMIYQVALNTKFTANKSSGDFVIGVKDNPALFKMLTGLAAAKKIGTRTMKVKAVSSAGDAADCNIVFVSPGDIAAFADPCKASNTLLYTEDAGSCTKGAQVSFFIGGDSKPKFEISESNMKAAGLTPSGKLLAMGKKV